MGAGPVQPVRGQRPLVAVVVAVLGAAPLLARLHKGQTLAGQVDARRHAVLCQQIGVGAVVIAAAAHGGQFVPEGVVVMGRDVLHDLPGALGPEAVCAAAPRADRVQHIVAMLRCAVDIARVGRIKDVALDAVPRVIAEKSDAFMQRVEGALVGGACAAFKVRAAAHPGLAVQ